MAEVDVSKNKNKNKNKDTTTNKPDKTRNVQKLRMFNFEGSSSSPSQLLCS